MITKITITDPTDLVVPWWHKTKTLEPIKEINFKSGLNIIFGPNGCGKSSILRLIARMFHAEQGRFSTITSDSIQELKYGFHNDGASVKRKSKEIPQGAQYHHDGQGIAFFDPSHKAGLIGGGAAFDHDFMEDGMRSIMCKGSSGQLVNNELGLLIKTTMEKKDMSPIFKASFPKETIEQIKEFLKPNIEKGPITFLLDEPDRSGDIPHQKEMWSLFQRVSDAHKAQLIVSTHSIFALNIPGAHYIEVVDGYIEKCKQAIK